MSHVEPRHLRRFWQDVYLTVIRELGYGRRDARMAATRAVEDYVAYSKWCEAPAETRTANPWEDLS